MVVREVMRTASLAALLLAGCAGPQGPLSAQQQPGQVLVSKEGGGDDVEQTGTAGKVREPTRESRPIAGTDLVRGRSTVIVNAPIDLVRKAVLNYDAYAEFMPHYVASKVLGKNPDGGYQVYMKWEALNGAMKMWARFDMSAAKKDGKAETYSSKLIEGNVKAAKAIWRLEPVDDSHTKLTLEVFLHPDAPLPSSLLNHENVQGAAKGVVAMRDHIEEQAK
jgi:ribosome-associated toxin RatA of RatAB toxin-antitoxin module